MKQRIELTVERSELFSLSHSLCLTGRIYGQLSQEKFEVALHKMLKEYPVLNSHVGFLENGARTLDAVDESMIEPLYYPYGEVNYIDKYIEKEERIPFDLEHGPLCKVIVFKGEERSTILLLASSLIADGQTLKSTMEDILYYLNYSKQAESERSATLISLKESISSGQRLGLFDVWKTQRINRMWRKQSHEFSKEEYLYHYGAYHKAHKTPVLIKEIHKRSTKSLLHNCVDRKVSVEAALLTAFLAVMNTFDRSHAGKEILIHYAVDLREELSSKCSPLAGKLDSLLVFKKQYTTGVSFWDNVKSVDNYLQEKLQNKRQCLKNLMLGMKLDGLLLESLPFQSYGGFDSQAGKKVLELFSEMPEERGIGFYPLKEVTYPQEEEFYIDSLSFIPPAFPYNDFTIGAIIVNGRLRLCIRYDKSHYSERIVEDMVRAAVNYMWNRTENHEIRKPLI